MPHRPVAGTGRGGGGAVPWNVQNVNTNPANFYWERDRASITCAAPGLYEVRFSSYKILHVEYTERGYEYGILFIFSLFCEYIYLEYVRIHGIYRVNQAEYGIHILVVAPQIYVNIYSTRRYKILFYFRALLWETIILLLPPPTCKGLTQAG